MPPPHTYSGHELTLVDPDRGRASGIVTDRLARLVADALQVDFRKLAVPPLPPASVGPSKVGPAPRRRPLKIARRLDDDADEREADAQAASIGPAPAPPPAGTQLLLRHTFVFTIPPPPANEAAARRRAAEADLNRIRSIFDEADPALVGRESLPLGSAHLDFSPDSGPIVLLHPAVLPPRPTPRYWSSPSHKKQALLYLAKVGEDLGTAQADNSSFLGKHKVRRDLVRSVVFD